jgi:glutamyl/glutaminyl-tRNA synthetase
MLPASRIAADAAPYLQQRGALIAITAAALTYVESLLPMVVGVVDRLEEIPERLAFIFSWDAAEAARLVTAEADGRRAVVAFAEAVSATGPLVDRETFRAAAARAREACGLKGRALFHPIRVALTAAESGPELDIAVPAIERGAALDRAAGVAPISSCLDRLRAVTARL